MTTQKQGSGTAQTSSNTNSNRKTRRKNKQRSTQSTKDLQNTDLVAELSIVFGREVLEPVAAGNRNEGQQMRALFRALQLFKENRLAGVIMCQSQAEESLYQELLSLQLIDIGLDPDDFNYLQQRGLRYVGEVYMLQFDARGGHKAKNRRERIFNIVSGQLGLPESMNVLAFWTPPYWSDTGFLDALNRPVGELVNDTSEYWLRKSFTDDRFVKNRTRIRWLHLRGFHYGGQYLAMGRSLSADAHYSARGGWGLGALKERQSTLKANCGLWAAALLPPDWQVPEDVPQEWVDDQIVMQEEIRQGKEEAALEKERMEQAAKEREQQAEQRKSELLRLLESQREPMTILTFIENYVGDKVNTRIRNGLFLEPFDQMGPIEFFSTPFDDVPTNKFFHIGSRRQVRDAVKHLGLSFGMSIEDAISAIHRIIY